MRIGWFTPFSRDSAIGRFSQAVTEHLGRSIEVDLWVKEAEDMLATDLRAVRYRHSEEADPLVLRQYDLVVYNLGDSPLHEEIFEISRRVPGVVILHDSVMHHFFAHYHVIGGRRPHDYVSLLRQHYGSAGEAFAREATADSRLWRDSNRIARFPLFEPAIDGALGVVVHSEEQQTIVGGAYSGPMKRLRLPWVEEPWVPSGSPVEPLAPAGKLLMLTTGHVNDNRRISVVLQALARSPLLREVLVYAIVGPVAALSREQLSEQVDSLGLGESVMILGRLPDDEFHAWLRGSDLCVNLRWPVMEGASASLVEQMMHGKPIVVTDAGAYREIPGDCVLKVDPSAERGDLTRALTRLAGSAALRRGLGERAREWATRELSPRGYAAGFRDFAEGLAALEPVHGLMRRVAAHLSEFGARADDPILEKVASEAYQTFCVPPATPRGLRDESALDADADADAEPKAPSPGPGDLEPDPEGQQ